MGEWVVTKKNTMFEAPRGNDGTVIRVTFAKGIAIKGKELRGIAEAFAKAVSCKLVPNGQQ